MFLPTKRLAPPLPPLPPPPPGPTHRWERWAGRWIRMMSWSRCRETKHGLCELAGLVGKRGLWVVDGMRCDLMRWGIKPRGGRVISASQLVLGMREGWWGCGSWQDISNRGSWKHQWFVEARDHNAGNNNSWEASVGYSWPEFTIIRARILEYSGSWIHVLLIDQNFAHQYLESYMPLKRYQKGQEMEDSGP